MSDWLQRNQWVYVVLFIVAAVLVWRATKSQDEQANSDNVSDETWFLDVETGEFFRAKRDLVPPIKSPAGNDGVWATVYGCGSCGPDRRFYGYLTKHTDDLKRRAEADPGVKASLYAEKCKGRLYSLDGKTWIAADSAEEAGAIDHFRNRCPDGDLRRCP